MVFKITQGDTSPSLLSTLSGEDGPVDLTNTTDIRFIMQDRYEQIIIDDNLQGSVNITDASSGEVEYVFDSTDTSDVGEYTAEFEVEYNNGAIETFPTDTKINVEIVEQIG